MSASTPSDATDAFEDVDATTTSELPIQIANSISIAACVAVLISYIVFYRRAKRLMLRPSLVLAGVAMNSTDLLLHCVNMVGYSDLKQGFVCSFFGGFLYAQPTLLAIFYSICIALNTQLVFVFGKRPGPSTLKWYLSVPLVVSLAICIPALATHVYGYDSSWDLCWISTSGDKSQNKVLLNLVFTFALWCLLALLYLIVAAITIAHALWSKDSTVNHLATNLSHSISNLSYKITTPTRATTTYDPELAITKCEQESTITTGHARQTTSNNRMGLSAPQKNTTLSRRTLAMRALALRLLGYIIVPMICILPGVINDLISKADPALIERLPDQVNTLFDTLNGLVGLFNAILYALDPALLALYHQIKVERQDRKLGRTVNRDVIQMNESQVLPPSPMQQKTFDLGSAPSVSFTDEPAEPKSIFRSHRWKDIGRRASNLSLTGVSTRTPRSTPGIVIRVDVEVNNDLDQLEDYLLGL